MTEIIATKPLYFHCKHNAWSTLFMYKFWVILWIKSIKKLYPNCTFLSHLAIKTNKMVLFYKSFFNWFKNFVNIYRNVKIIEIIKYSTKWIKVCIVSCNILYLIVIVSVIVVVLYIIASCWTNRYSYVKLLQRVDITIN